MATDRWWHEEPYQQPTQEDPTAHLPVHRTPPPQYPPAPPHELPPPAQPYIPPPTGPSAAPLVLGGLGLAAGALSIVLAMRPIDAYLALGLAIAGMILSICGARATVGSFGIIVGIIALAFAFYSVHEYNQITDELQRNLDNLRNLTP